MEGGEGEGEEEIGGGLEADGSTVDKCEQRADARAEAGLGRIFIDSGGARVDTGKGWYRNALLASAGGPRVSPISGGLINVFEWRDVRVA